MEEYLLLVAAVLFGTGRSFSPASGCTVIAVRCTLGALLVTVALELLLGGFSAGVRVVSPSDGDHHVAHDLGTGGLFGAVIGGEGPQIRWCRCFISLRLIRTG